VKKLVINSKNAPNPIGPYSQAVQAGNFLYLSGQIAINPQTGELESSDIAKETVQVMENIGAVLKAAGLTFKDVIKTSIFLKDLNNFSAVNEVYGSYFESEFPARECVEVSKLPKDVNVEISTIAFKN